ncbi:ABC transporter ATP-binding protein [Pandoraea sp. NPDC087047]|uniref:ABC transporter ATP-binding protein n=1 Tax=Pandoraea sp. NPDC087047 TaxID=3364390 RepID=UPI0037FB6911
MIALDGLTKSYRTPTGRHYVFRDLSLTLPPGKSIGVLGPNGAGKSTLLRIIGGIDRPDRGRVSTQGSISWPVGLSGGFLNRLSGRDNVKFVCRLYSRPDDIAQKVEFVREFAGIGKYFDMPIGTYSSGMRSRLGFGLSLAFDFDYYLLDEVTAVGDAAFQHKCAEHIERKRANANFLMVSHQVTSLKKYCDIGLWLAPEGAKVFEDIDEAIHLYRSHDTR